MQGIKLFSWVTQLALSSKFSVLTSKYSMLLPGS